jgi:uncharacterized protein
MQREDTDEFQGKGIRDKGKEGEREKAKGESLTPEHPKTLKPYNPITLPPTPCSRRQFLLRNVALFGSYALGNGLVERNTVETTFCRLPMPGLKEPLRLIQLSDLHRSWCVSEGFIARIVNKTNTLRPDTILLTGDFVTYDSVYAESCARQLARLRAPLGLYGCLGNHDHDCGRGRGGPAVVSALAEANVHMLTNRSVRFDNRLYIVGVDDCHTGRPDLKSAFRGIERGAPIIAMTHNPNYYREMKKYECVTLAGHTHGGQINLPFLTTGLLSIRHSKNSPVYKQGWFRDKGYPGRMYVSRGLGVVGIPFRYRATPEIVVFDLIPV